ncbi:variable surface protein [Plasmodium gonderi]|uniref:Variable surface protein n=1 Tax=Plasmodium gonderi TaxID=77519 RepID=A0A1Y1JEM0_PLAGO|nr:variable surface protein [Plasmodium gonderi]GAW79202.1 variable surface protein [Plasmodium gonderi]
MVETEKIPFNVDKFVKEVHFYDISDTLKSTELIKFYNKLNEYLVNTKTHSENCADITDPKLNLLCLTVEKIFDNWNSICNLVASSKDKCYDYLNYWVYGKILEYDSGHLYIFQFYKRLKELLKKKVNVAQNDTYSKHFEQVTYRDTLRNKKELFDFAQYYDYIIKVITGEASGKEDQHCKYFMYILDIYSIIKNEYSQELSKIYNKEAKLLQSKLNAGNNLYSLLDKCSKYDEPNGYQNIEELKSRFHRQNAEGGALIHVPMPAGLDMKTILEELPSNKIYKELNNHESSTKYDSYCNDLGGSNTELKPLCRKLVRNLKDISESKIMKDLTHGERCLHFIFWAYEEIGKIFNWSWRNVHSIHDAKKFLEVWGSVSVEAMKKGVSERVNLTMNQIDSNCTRKASDGSCIRHRFIKDLGGDYALNNYKTCLYYIDCTYNECKEMKYLHDYFNNFETIKNKITSTTTCPKYYAYLDYITKLYEKYRYSDNGDCCNWRDCGDFLKCGEDLNPKKLKELSACNTEIYNSEISDDGKGEHDEFESLWSGFNWEDEISAYDTDEYGYESTHYGLPDVDNFALNEFGDVKSNKVASNQKRLLKFLHPKNKIKYIFLIAGISYLAFALFRVSVNYSFHMNTLTYYNHNIYFIICYNDIMYFFFFIILSLIDKNLKKKQKNDFGIYIDEEESSLYDSWDHDAYKRMLNLGYYPAEESVYY